jgi:hypothetical protein
MMKTASGRVSRTKIVALASFLLQIVNAVLAYVGTFDTMTALQIASALGIAQSFLKWILRNITSEAVEGKGPDAADPTKSTFLAVVVLLVAGCATSGPWPNECETVVDVPKSMEKYFPSGETKINVCHCDQLIFPINKHPHGKPSPAGVVMMRCDGELIPFAAVSENVEVPKCK